MDGSSHVVISALEPADPPRPVTVADALAELRQWTDLVPSRVAKLRTALGIAARILAPGRSSASAAAIVVLDCSTLRPLVEMPAAKLGMTASRKTSMLSELRYVLRRLDLHEPDSRGHLPSTPELLALHAALPRHQALALTDFLRFIEASAVPLELVDVDVLRAYEQRCAERTLCRDPAARGRQVTGAWNWARLHLQKWTTLPTLARPKAQTRYTLPLSSYPVSFQEDVKRHLDLLAKGDVELLFTEEAPATEEAVRRRQRPLRATTIRTRLQHIRAAAAAFVANGEPPEVLRSLEDLVNPPERAKGIILFHLKRHGGTANSISFRIADALRLIASDYCRLPPAQVAQLAIWAKRVKLPKQVGLTEKNRTRLRALMEPLPRAMLLNFPQELMKRAAKAGKPQEAARLAMNAAAMEILLICPLRLSNLSGLRLDQHLHRPDPRKPMITQLLISETEAKNEVPIQWPVPPETAKMIQLYVDKYRPALARHGNVFLFPGAGTGPATAMGAWLPKAVTRAIGVEYNIHLSRHFAAWNFLSSNPGQYEVVRRVLGHKDIRTTMTYYVGLEAEASARHFDATVLRDRAATRYIANQAFKAGRGARSVASRARS